MNNKDPFSVHLPVELFEDWIKQNGVDDGQMTENQDVNLNNIKFDTDTGYLIVEGDLNTRLDS